jgi:hypothetical protein
MAALERAAEEFGFNKPAEPEADEIPY